MRKIREVMLRLRLEADLSVRQISICTKVSVGSIQKLLKSAQALGLTWPLPTELDDGRLAALFYPAGRYHHLSPVLCQVRPLSPQGAQAEVSKRLLWEYTQRYPNSCAATPSSIDRYDPWCQLQRSMPWIHKGRGKALYGLQGRTSWPLLVRSVEHKSLSAVSVRPTTPFTRATWSQSLPVAAKPCPCL